MITPGVIAIRNGTIRAMPKNNGRSCIMFIRRFLNRGVPRWERRAVFILADLCSIRRHLAL